MAKVSLSHLKCKDNTEYIAQTNIEINSGKYLKKVTDNIRPVGLYSYQQGDTEKHNIKKDQRREGAQ